MKKLRLQSRKLRVLFNRDPALFTKTVLFALAGWLLFGLAVPAEINAQTAPPAKLRSMLPHKVGKMVRGEGSLLGAYALVAYQTTAGKGNPVILMVGYGPKAQKEMRKEVVAKMRKDSVDASKIKVDGYTIRVGKTSKGVGAVGFPGNTVIYGYVLPKNKQVWDTERARKNLLTVLRGLDWDRFASVQINMEEVVKPVEHKKLKSLLPEQINGLETDSRSSWSFGRSSTAEGIYRGKVVYPEEGKAMVSSESKWITVLISDIGPLPESEVPEKYNWISRDIGYVIKDGDQRTAEKVVSYRDYKAHVQRVPGMGFRRIDVFVADRFVVEVKGKNVTMAKLKNVLGRIDLKKLAALAE